MSVDTFLAKLVTSRTEDASKIQGIQGDELGHF